MGREIFCFPRPDPENKVGAPRASAFPGFEGGRPNKNVAASLMGGRGAAGSGQKSQSNPLLIHWTEADQWPRGFFSSRPH